MNSRGKHFQVSVSILKKGRLTTVEAAFLIKQICCYFVLIFRWRSKVIKPPPCPNLLWHGNVRRDRTRHKGEVWRDAESHWRHYGTSYWIFDHQWNRVFPFSDQGFCIFEDQQIWDRLSSSEKVSESLEMKTWMILKMCCLNARSALSFLDI